MKTGNWLICPECEKPVRLKRWLGTLHACLLPEERAKPRRTRPTTFVEVVANMTEDDFMVLMREVPGFRVRVADIGIKGLRE